MDKFEEFDNIRILIGEDEANFFDPEHKIKDTYVYGQIINEVLDRNGNINYDIAFKGIFSVALNTEPEHLEKPNRIEILLYF